MTVDPNAIMKDRWVAVGSAIVNLYGIKDRDSLLDAAAFAEVSALDLASKLFGFHVMCWADILCDFCCDELGLNDLAGKRVCNDERCVDEATAPVTAA